MKRSFHDYVLARCHTFLSVQYPDLVFLDLSTGILGIFCSGNVHIGKNHRETAFRRTLNIEGNKLIQIV